MNFFEESGRYIPGGVNSPVRSFRATGLPPVFIRKAEGKLLYDEEGREFTDFCLSWGVMILGIITLL